MIMKLIFQAEPSLKFLVGGLVFLNILVWGWALLLFRHNTTFMATCLLAWSYGLRHAMDADHIAAIDNVTRKMIQQNQRSYSIGAWFSLGHSSIVIIASISIALMASAMKENLSWLHETGSVIGTLVSALFLIIIALVNLVILCNIWRSFRNIKQGQEVIVGQDVGAGGGMMTWILQRTFHFVSHSWQMYLVGFLFGLGFDTATEIGILGISAVSSSSGMSIWSILIFPALFTAGMILIDTLDNIIMVGAYGWGVNKPQRKLYYNMTITGTSVIVALFIGGTEALGLLMDKLSLQGGFWNIIAILNDNLANAGWWVVGLFIFCWGASFLNYRLRGYDDSFSH